MSKSQSVDAAKAKAEALFRKPLDAGDAARPEGVSAEAEKIAKLRMLRLAKEEAERAAPAGARARR